MYYLCGSYGMNGWIYNNNTSIQNYGAGVPEPAYWGGLSSPPSPGTPPYANYFVNPKYSVQSANTPSFFDCNWHEAYPWNFMVGGFPVVDSPPTDFHSIPGTVWPGTRPPSNSANGSQMCRVCMPRHGPAVNVAFMDGHAATVPLPQLWTLQWSPLSIRRPCPAPGVPKN